MFIANAIDLVEIFGRHIHTHTHTHTQNTPQVFQELGWQLGVLGVFGLFEGNWLGHNEVVVHVKPDGGQICKQRTVLRLIWIAFAFHRCPCPFWTHKPGEDCSHAETIGSSQQ